MITTVVNIHQEEYDVYIGRAGQGQDGYFGNPVVIGAKCPMCHRFHMSNGSTILCYSNYFRHRLRTDAEFKERVESLRGKRLGCFCRPRPCHGTVIADYLNKGESHEEL